jgi:hypothetical protein
MGSASRADGGASEGGHRPDAAVRPGAGKLCYDERGHPVCADCGEHLLLLPDGRWVHEREVGGPPVSKPVAMDGPCPCGSGLSFEACCKRLLNGRARIN